MSRMLKVKPIETENKMAVAQSERLGRCGWNDKKFWLNVKNKFKRPIVSHKVTVTYNNVLHTWKLLRQ